MEIISVYPKDVYVTIEFSLDELKKIRLAFDLAKIDFDSKVEKEKEAVSFITTKLYPNIKTIVEEAEKKSGS